ncbi:MAG: hypothetical protein LBG51_01880 [Bacteroidales bacterium OttesenSCG-928-I14]|nr:hypothetical protein [Bacteroidales bacterium OttesenSCG-928-I14]
MIVPWFRGFVSRLVKDFQSLLFVGRSPITLSPWTCPIDDFNLFFSKTCLFEYDLDKFL